MRTIYLDNAAATPLDERVFAVMQPYLTSEYYNPSAAYQPARDIRAAIAEAKHRLAMVIGARASEIIVTAGATESINLALQGVMRHYGGSIITSTIEHPAVIETAKQFESAFVTPNKKGVIDPESVNKLITDTTTIISIGYANSELGVIQPLKAIADIISAVRIDRKQRHIDTPIFFHTDASQAAGYLDLSVARLGVDMMTLNASKCYGPKQVGLLWVDAFVQLSPLIYGGGQERGLRSGTENVAGVVGFAKSLDLSDKHRKAETHRLAILRDRLQRHLTDKFEGLVINGNTKKRLPNHLHISLPGLDGERALFALDSKGVLVATGSACAANKGTRSHVLEAIGMSDELADGSLRITLGRMTTEQDVDRAAELIEQVLKEEWGK